MFENNFKNMFFLKLNFNVNVFYSKMTNFISRKRQHEKTEIDS